jgi:glycosyltransferase involved in cell wall biosynthesis
MKISICIPTYNRPEQVQALLANLLEQRDVPDEVVLVDASAGQATQAVADAFKVQIPSLVYERYAKGLTLQRNRAIELATGDIVVFLDDDVLLDTEFVYEARKTFEKDHDGKIAGLTGIQLNQKARKPGVGWTLKRCTGIIETDQPGRLLACGETTPLPCPRKGELCRVDYLPGCLNAWRKAVFNDFRYSLFFRGYGLGEDKYFSGCVSHKYQLFISGDLKANHFHVPGNRPDPFQWGYYNVFNHCFIMRECSRGRMKALRFFLFHLIDAIKDLVTWPFRADALRSLQYGVGRLAGLARCLVRPPIMKDDDPARINRMNMP